MKINLSCSFVSRTRCKGCGKCSNGICFFMFVPISPFDISKFKQQSLSNLQLRKHFNNNIINELPPNLVKEQDFSSTFNQSYGVSLHSKKGVIPVIEYLSCVCGATTWAVTYLAESDKLASTHRLSKAAFPGKMSY